MTEVIFAGAWVGPDGVKPDATKLTAVVDWRQPMDLLGLLRFLGLTGYFRDLVENYARIAQPLTDLICGAAIPKDCGKAAYRAVLQAVKLTNVWTPAHSVAFLGLKTILTSEPVLKAPCFDGTPFIVTTDGSKDGFNISRKPDQAAKSSKNYTQSHLHLNAPQLQKHATNHFCLNSSLSNFPSINLMTSFGDSPLRSKPIVRRYRMYY
jgi:hypothetical protein